MAVISNYPSWGRSSCDCGIHILHYVYAELVLTVELSVSFKHIPVLKQTACEVLSLLLGRIVSNARPGPVDTGLNITFDDH